MKFIFSLLLLVAFLKLEAQQTRIDNGAYIEYAGCEILKYVAPPALEEYANGLDCKSRPEVSELQNKYKEQNQLVAVALYQEILSLKNSDVMTYPAIRLKKFLSEAMFEKPSAYQKINTFFKKHRQDEQYPELKAQIENYLNDYAELQPAADSSIQPVTKAVSSEPSVEISDPSSNSFAGIAYEIDIFAWMFAILLVLLIYRFVISIRKDIKRKLAETDALLRNLPQRQNISADPTNNNPRKLDEIYDKLQNMQRQIDAFRTAELPETEKPVVKPDLWEREPSFQIQIPSNSESISVQHDTPASHWNGYLPTPNPDGTFNTGALTANYKEGASIYRVKSISPERMLFEIEENPTSVVIALQHIKIVIEPCCDALNVYTPSVRQILTIAPGEMELQGDKWKIIKKSTINYEN